MDGSKRLYDNPSVYDLFDSEKMEQVLRAYYASIFSGRVIRTIHDCSFGTGNLTFPIENNNIYITGSDISIDMLNRAEMKAVQRDSRVKLYQADFRELSSIVESKFDCVMSTGNSLAHVPNDDLRATLRQMDLLVNPGGYIYFDSRNWERILKSHQRFYFYNPVIEETCRTNVYQVWDYNSDGTITFNFVYVYEQDGRITKKEIYTDTYYPFGLEFAKSCLCDMGYTNIEVISFPANKDMPFEDMEWYALMAKKRDC